MATRACAFAVLVVTLASARGSKVHVFLGVHDSLPAASDEGLMHAHQHFDWLLQGKDWLQSKGFSFIEPVMLLARKTVHKRDSEMQTPLTYQGQQQPQPTSPVDQVLAQLIHLLFSVAITALAAYLYVNHKPDFGLKVSEGDKPENLNGTFKHGLFRCFDTPLLSLFTCCCFPVRWADSMRMVGLVTFIVGVAIMGISDAFASTFVGGAAWIAVAVVGTMYRQKMRAAFDMESTHTVMFLDFLSWCCCSCCATVQEARQVEEAKMLGHKAVQGEFQLTMGI